MTGDLHSEAGEPLVNVTFFAKLWVGEGKVGHSADKPLALTL